MFKRCYQSSFPKPSDYALANAYEKAKEVFERLKGTANLVIGADTIVVLRDRILEKPADEDHARRMLKDLSGSQNEVITAVALFFRDPNDPAKQKWTTRTFVEKTVVQMAPFTDDMIDAYVKTGEPL
ncbi:hypothetical protein HK102_008807 [Quaeritorhiza haematococci]|nr:hypothetical protein HK102_008807 [Quaeritorhiza haematococci]